ncbi:MAG TPA: metallophosphoesterase [Polyangiaceae bacterium]|nr:metallophosphoesterase [Polyangiaceae bacterium]
MGRFLRILVAITTLIHLPVALGAGDLLMRLGVQRPFLWGGLWALLGVAAFVGRARAGMPDRRRRAILVRLVDIPYFIHWCAAVFAFVPSVLATLVAPLAALVLGAPARVPIDVYMASYIVGLVVCGYGVLVRRRWFRVVERVVVIPALDPRLEGFRIAHLSDLHIGTLTPRSWGLGWARSANRKKPHLTVVTGDLVTSGNDYHPDVADVLEHLQAEHGVFASMGNHDYFGDGERLVTLLRRRGVRVLRNEGVLIEHQGARLWLAGLDDTWTQRDDLEATMRHRPPGAPAVLLAHDPTRFDAAVDAGAALVLSGHTHGGQIGLPFLYRFVNVAAMYRYRLGFYRRRASVLYVHPGLGTTGPPIRLGVVPEVTVLVLRSMG